MDFDNKTTALVVTDPQNDFLSEDGAAWPLVGDSVRENNTIANLEALMTASRDGGYKIFVSPHYYYPADQQWQFGGALERKMHEIGMFTRRGPLVLAGFEGSGADWLARLKPLLTGSNTIVVSPHKVYGPQTNDLALQLRKHGISKLLLAGMSANLCVESHMRDLVEQGFEVFVVKDATAAARDPKLGDGYQAAVVNFNFIASKALTTREAVDAMWSGARGQPLRLQPARTPPTMGPFPCWRLLRSGDAAAASDSVGLRKVSHRSGGIKITAAPDQLTRLHSCCRRKTTAGYDRERFGSKAAHG